jgi:tRNA(Arg) A34 adenosine deaminase TadA
MPPSQRSIVNPSRRRAAVRLAAAALTVPFARRVLAFVAESRWYDAALAMKVQALRLGDQPYGAVLVAGDAIIGEGPSRVVQRGDPDAHAEREAIRDARRRLGRENLAGSILYSTSRPCRQCERAAASAGVARMIYGPALTDAGRPSA